MLKKISDESQKNIVFYESENFIDEKQAKKIASEILSDKPTQVSFEECKFIGNAFEIICNAIKENKNFKALDIANSITLKEKYPLKEFFLLLANANINTDINLKKLADSDGYIHIKDIVITDIYIKLGAFKIPQLDNKDYENLTAALKDKPSLVTLVLDSLKINDEQLKILSEVLYDNENISTLYLNKANLSAEGFKLLSEICRRMPNLSSLYLNKVDLREKDAYLQVALLLGMHKKLEYISFDGAYFTTEGVKQLFKVMGNSKSIRYINFDNIALTNELTKLVIELLRKNINIQEFKYYNIETDPTLKKQIEILLNKEQAAYSVYKSAIGKLLTSYKSNSDMANFSNSIKNNELNEVNLNNLILTDKALNSVIQEINESTNLTSISISNISLVSNAYKRKDIEEKLKKYNLDALINTNSFTGNKNFINFEELRKALVGATYIMPDKVENLLQFFNNIKFELDDEIYANLSSALVNQKNLKHITLGGKNLDHHKMAGFIKGLNGNKINSLEELTIDNTLISIDWYSAVIDLTLQPNLKTLNIINCQFDNEQDYKFLREIFSRSKKIETLNLTETYPQDNSKSFIETMFAFPNLKKIIWKGVALSTNDLIHLHRLLENNQNITELEIDDHSINPNNKVHFEKINNQLVLNKEKAISEAAKLKKIESDTLSFENEYESFRNIYELVLGNSLPVNAENKSFRKEHDINALNKLTTSVQKN